jgi:quercetin dioxygenase-like cupin family protein
MKHAKLADMVKGWFVGDFDPVVLRSTAVEVAVKHYRAGDREDLHHHRVATEVTVIVSGSVRMLGRTWGAGDIVVIEPGEATAFEALTDVVNVVVKLPSAKDDKFLGRADGSGDG